MLKVTSLVLLIGFFIFILILQPVYSMNVEYYSTFSISAVETIIQNKKYLENELSMPIQNNNISFSIGGKFYKNASLELFALTHSNYITSEDVDGKYIINFYGIGSNYDFKFGKRKKAFTYTPSIGFGISTLSGIIGYSNSLTFNLKQSINYRIQKNLDFFFSVNATVANFKFEHANALPQNNYECEECKNDTSQNNIIMYNTINDNILLKTKSSTFSLGILDGSNSQMALIPISDLTLYDKVKISELSYIIEQNTNGNIDQYLFCPEEYLDTGELGMFIPHDTPVKKIDDHNNEEIINIEDLATFLVEPNSPIILLDKSTEWIKEENPCLLRKPTCPPPLVLLEGKPQPTPDGQSIMFTVKNKNEEIINYTIIKQKDIENLTLENLSQPIPDIPEVTNNIHINQSSIYLTPITRQGIDITPVKEEGKQILKMDNFGRTINLIFSFGIKMIF